MKKLITTGLLLFGIFILTTIIAFSAVPQLINYQGRLLDSAGDPINDGLYHIKFAIYNAPTDGTELWVDTFRKVGVNNGLFNVALGDMTAYPFPHDLFTDTLLYLGVTVQGESEMTPRTRLLTVPYSYHSLRADTAGSVDWTDIDISSDDIFNGTLSIGDSTLRADSNGVRIGDGEAPSSSFLIRNDRTYNTDQDRYGYYSYLKNQSSGDLFGAYLIISDWGSGDVYGLKSSINGDGDNRYGLYGIASQFTSSNYSGKSYGVFADGRFGEEAYGIYASAEYGLTNYAGYFSGDVTVTGTLSKAGGSFKIDHPLDPEHKYLQHSFIESPDMMNMYNGNIITDDNGYATVIMPDYFTVLNRDFRYQLTVIGDFAQAIVAEEISNNQFSIRTDKPNIKVSWQVTGIRHDNWANDNRIEVEIDKPTK
ncbi:MAG: hypothetical protein U9N54_00750, partial [candidate division Zixibacteria bacterium]|nr:hypothetical protein [candidate division Zixibacteria bacterium]